MAQRILRHGRQAPTAGVLFLVIVVALISLSIAIYNKAFTDDRRRHAARPTTPATSCIPDSDVKERGIIVGSVKSVTSRATGAVVTLALDPGRVKHIPNERLGADPAEDAVRRAVRVADPARDEPRPARSRPATSSRRTGRRARWRPQKVLGDLLPLLTAVQPAELNATLTALATRCTAAARSWAQTLVNFDKYLKIMNPHTQAARRRPEEARAGGAGVQRRRAGLLRDAAESADRRRARSSQKRAGLDSLLVTGVGHVEGAAAASWPTTSSG